MFIKLGLVLVTLTAAMCLGGCRSNKPTSQASGDQPKAVYCDKCKTIWVTNPALKLKHVYYTPAKVMTCPDCHHAVEQFFRTGELKHHCDSCGGDMEPCEIHS